MSSIFKDRHAKLGCMVLKLFPKVMQMILKYYVTPHGLQRKYSTKDFRFVMEDYEIHLMDNLPNIDEFTIVLCYKILRSENMLDEPKCKWGNVPHATAVEITDDIQRLINATNVIISINSTVVTEGYSENMQEEIKCMVTRIDSFLKLKQDTLESIYNSLCRSETDSLSILQDLTRVIAIKEYLPYTHSEKEERYSKLSAAILDTLINILRRVIGSEFSPSQLYQISVPYHNDHNYFLPNQQENLKKLQHVNTYDSLDITLIYRLLRQFSSIPAPTKGWGGNPDKADIRLGDDVERIRSYRNELVHRVDTNIDKSEFDNYFDNFRDIGQRMDSYFKSQTDYEWRLNEQRTRMMNTELQPKYENAMKEIENIKLKYERKPIRFYWGESFDWCLSVLRKTIHERKTEGMKKIRLQIIIQKRDNAAEIVSILNALKEDINKDLSGIEFIAANEGSLVLNVDLPLKRFKTDDKLHATLALFIETILKRISLSTSENIDMVVRKYEEYPQWENPKCSKTPVYIDFDIEAHLFESNAKMEGQLGKISDAITKRANGSGSNQNITATLLPIDLGNLLELSIII